ncbi:MAG TPA: FkbM family methyltransferase [Acidobacteriaceae bacterium]|jgi:FkbM family methyltransferase|nr:FkbM family methyltransferase [Acidobacteriaceae bacterium]
MSLKQLALKYLPAPALRSARTHHYLKQLQRYSLSEEPDLFGCKALLHPGEVVLDIGANIGVYTRFLSEFVGPSGQVHALEPIPETYSYLSCNVTAIGLRNVTCYNLAASDKDQDHASMSMPQYASGGSNIYEATLSDSGDIPVATARLDTLFSHLSPSFIKCDVEGHEIPCLQGALDLIARCRPYWLVEVSSRRTLDMFTSLGYETFLWSEGAFRPATPADRAPNFFFFPGEKAPR